VGDELTKELPGERSFEERVFARFDAIERRFVDRFSAIDKRFDGVDARLDSLDGRVQALEARVFDTKPVWERALAEILEVKKELRTSTASWTF
jgi:hypothetical protein